MFDNVTTEVSYFDQSNGSLVPVSVSKNVVVPSVMFFLGVLGNITAIIILTVRPSQNNKSTAFYHLVKALAYTDLFGILASSPVTIVVYINNGVVTTGGMALCHYFSFILVLAGNVTVYIVLVMAVERYIVTKYPFKYSKLVKPLTVNGSILLVWAVSTLAAVLPILGVGRNVQPWPGTWCFFDYRMDSLGGHLFSYSYAIAGLSAILLTIFLNLIVTRHLWRMRRSRLNSLPLRSPKHCCHYRRPPDSERKMVLFLMAITVVFTICYAPFMIRIIMNQINSGRHVPSGGLDDTLDLWALRLACLNQILDPWVYIISRVTCCRSPRDSDDNQYSHTHKSGDELSNSIKSYHAVHSLTSPDRGHFTPVQSTRFTKNPLTRAIQTAGRIFCRKRLVTVDSPPAATSLHSTPVFTNMNSLKNSKMDQAIPSTGSELFYSN